MRRLHWVFVALLASACDSSSTTIYPITLAMTPTKPVVINTPFDRLTGEKDDNGNPITETVPASWFYSNYQITNDGTSTITVISLTVTLTLPLATDGSSNSTSNTATCQITADERTLGRTYLMEIASKASQSINWYCSGLSFPANAGYSAAATIQVNGWIGAHTAPQDRLNTKVFSFNTQ